MEKLQLRWVMIRAAAVFIHPSIMIRACCAAQGVVVGRGAQEGKNAFVKQTIILYHPKKLGFAHPGVYS
jgi:hypothetical protein